MTKAKPVTKEREEHIKENLAYCPKTGIITWKVSGSRRMGGVGSEAGSFTQRYRTIRCKGRLLLSHRIAWFLYYGTWPTEQLDHINQIKDDNRISNLREVTNQENHRNRTRNKNNTSGHTGVYWHAAAGNWAVEIGAKGKTKHLGRFTELEEAVKARKEAEVKYEYHENHGS